MSDPAEITIPDREMTFEEFLAWAETVPKEAGRFELWDGRVIAKHDMSAKLEAYFTRPSIRHYIIADPDKPLLIVHSRGQGDTLTTRLIADPTTRLRLDPPGLDVDLTEVLAG